jgi:hypothetical protein
MAKKAAGWSLIAKVMIRSEVSTRGICGRQIGKEKSVLRELRFLFAKYYPNAPYSFFYALLFLYKLPNWQRGFKKGSP